jgi:hypothetical protein
MGRIVLLTGILAGGLVLVAGFAQLWKSRKPGTAGPSRTPIRRAGGEAAAPTSTPLPKDGTGPLESLVGRASPEVPATDGEFRSKLRKYVRANGDPDARPPADPETAAELNEVWLEYYRLPLLRRKDPRRYADRLRETYEVALEGEGTALDAAQSAGLGSLFRTLGESLEAIPAMASAERLVRELELESTAMARVQELLTETQRAAAARRAVGPILSTALATAYVNKSLAEETITERWSRLVDLDAAQQNVARLAAAKYVEAVGRLEAETGTALASIFQDPILPASYEFRLRAAREQAAALRLVEFSLTGAQQERLRGISVGELFLFDDHPMGR